MPNNAFEDGVPELSSEEKSEAITYLTGGVLLAASTAFTWATASVPQSWDAPATRVHGGDPAIVVAGLGALIALGALGALIVGRTVEHAAMCLLGVLGIAFGIGGGIASSHAASGVEWQLVNTSFGSAPRPHASIGPGAVLPIVMSASVALVSALRLYSRSETWTSRTWGRFSSWDPAPPLSVPRREPVERPPLAE
jgi:hypothetical protein